MARILLCSCAVRVHDSQAYRNLNVTRECISRILELREMLLSFQTGFNLANAEWRISQASNPRINTTEPKYVELACDCLKLLSVYFDLLVDAAGVVTSIP